MPTTTKGCKSYLQKFRISNVNIGIIVMGIFSFCYGANSTYIGAMLTTIEKRFEFTSMEMGILMGANDIGYISFVILISYWGSRKGRAPITLCLTAIGLWFSSLIYTVPFLTFGPKYDSNTLMSFNQSQNKIYCNKFNTSIIPTNKFNDGKNEVTFTQKSVALFIFIFAGIIAGISASPFWNVGVSFLDDMASPKNSGIYIAILYGTRSVSPIVGYLIGSNVLKHHETLKLYITDYLPGQKDVRWIGAWWLGWLTLGFCVLLVAPFLCLLHAKPNKIVEDEQNAEKESNVFIEKADEPNVISKTTKESFKDLLCILKGTLKNKIYITLITGAVFEILSFVCLITFFTKYLEYHYRVSATHANIYTAISLAGSTIVSVPISGLMSHFVKMNIRSMNLYHAVVNTISAALFPILYAFVCPSVDVKGITNESRLSVCTLNCTCPLKKMNPVCLNGTTYFSPCLAGCTSQLNSTYFGQCGCDNLSYATTGFCEQMCYSVFGFIAAFFIIKVIGSIAAIQYTQMILRLTEPENKAVYMAVLSFIFGVCGFTLPPLAGSVLDLACLHRNVNVHGVSSHCLIYDNDKMRYLIMSIAFLFQIPACALYIMSWIYTPADYERKLSKTVASNYAKFKVVSTKETTNKKNNESGL